LPQRAQKSLLWALSEVMIVNLYLISSLIFAVDYGWTGWVPSPDLFCFDVLPILKAANIPVPNEVVNGNSLYC
jgi:hypothetical protein